MTDITSLLTTPVQDIKEAPTLPATDYFAVITGYKFDKSKEKKTDFVKYPLMITSAVDPSTDLSDINLSEADLSIDYYLTPKALNMLKVFIESTGEAMSGPSGPKSLGEMIPEMMGKQVVVTVEHQINSRDPSRPPYVRVNKMVGVK